MPSMPAPYLVPEVRGHAVDARREQGHLRFHRLEGPFNGS
jgi:hypothetical protein